MKTFQLVTWHDKDRKAEILKLENRQDARLKDYNSISCGYPTLEECKIKNKIPDEPCKSCGSPFSTCYSNAKELLAKNFCFNCNFWDDLVQQKDNSKHIVIEGKHYSIGPKTNGPSHWKGYGGAIWLIQKFDSDEIIKTGNLWHQGSIPDRFRDRLPDTPKFLQNL